MQYATVALIVAACAAFYWHILIRIKKAEKHCTNAGLNDPYIDHVRAMRALPGVDPEVAVSIQDSETGEFFYYPKGSEVRFKKDSKDRIHLDY